MSNTTFWGAQTRAFPWVLAALVAVSVLPPEAWAFAGWNIDDIVLTGR